MLVSSIDIPRMPFWPNNSPFHEGELQLQRKFGVDSNVAQYAPKFIRPYMPDQHREFYTSQPFVVVSARDSRGMMWATMLVNEGNTDFITSPDPFSLLINASLLPGDALHDAFQDGDDLGILGIEFGSKRRNRVNGRVRRHFPRGSIAFQVGQSFGNCPQYIKPRQWWKNVPVVHGRGAVPKSIERSTKLTMKQIEQIKNSDTLFVASGYRGEGDSPAFGNDVSHRGGPKGWIHVVDSRTIALPDFPGNDMYNTLGNIVMDSRFGITVPLLPTGGMIQMSGRATIDYDEESTNQIFAGALRLVIFTIDEVVTVADGSLPLSWGINNKEGSNIRKLRVVHKIIESADVTSFHLKPVEGTDPKLWDFKPGQYLPITLDAGDGKVLTRTYSLSDVPRNSEYRISVKREPFGRASRFLHDEIHEGDVIEAEKPAGEFVLGESSDRDIVLVSAGVGVTPVLSMLHRSAESMTSRSVFWVHGARNRDHHAFHGEVLVLQQAALGRISSHVVYSKPRAEDSGLHDSVGRITPELLDKIVPDLHNADFYMCGPPVFMADLVSGLTECGVEEKYINYEKF
jgi:ferredoxin-NADP reductase/predicted pyridoxine 5'-phosphate oxidase superfamily flavin-nucleotide-binding protein